MSSWSFCATGSQTVGPFFEIGLRWLYAQDIASAADGGERMWVRGRVLDGDERPVPDAVLEIWQADERGQYAADGCSGFGRVPTDAQGGFAFRTCKPGRVAAAQGGMQAPHLSLHVFARGLLKAVHTRLYFPNEPSNREDPVLALVPEARRATLIAAARGAGELEWNVRLQGAGETVFFSI